MIRVMFNFDSDRDDRRFAPPDKGEQPGDPDLDSTTTSAAGETEPRIDAIPAPTIEPAIPAPPSRQPAASPARQRAEQRRKPTTLKRNDWAWVIITIALFGVLVVIGLIIAVMFGLSRTSAAPLPDPIAALPTAVDARVRYDTSETDTDTNTSLAVRATPESAAAAQIIDIQPWDGTSRLNILFMGIDRRPGETGLGFRSDTMMIISLNPQTNQVGVLSIPRDLYVQVPGYSARQRINTALPLGELQRAEYGPTLAMQTVQYNFGMPMHEYIVADYTALITLIDAIGGVEIDVPTPINDPWFPDGYYGYDPLVLNEGLQWMDGETAQKYARTRHGDSDFGRARRQQQVIFAMRDRLLDMENLPTLIARAPSLYGSMSGSVFTSLELEQMLRLGMWLKDLDADAITTGVIDADYTYDFTTEDGSAVLMPRTDYLYGLFTRVFGANFAG